MKISELANRYAKAIFELAIEADSQEKIFSDLRSLAEICANNKEIRDFLTSPLVKPSERVAILEKATSGQGLAKESHDFLLLLAYHDRFELFTEIVQAFQDQADAANQVCRGIVRSAVLLGPEDRQRIETTVESVLKKKVIMTYKVDPTVIGGLLAQVGSYTFDDSISSHLRRMNEELKRRTV